MGSDLDLVAVVRGTDIPFTQRSLAWDLSGLPVPADLRVYTEREWRDLMRQGGRFARMLETEAVWILVREDNAAG